eukprot:TRINITY_DN12569_c0_g1_i17.p1 TRINITY_DN12569_c0_g1~~TRINITY_DN12569_c0_g1_i17.p1  ORF type:complete len:611 (-),score=216.40 TRINITY_DN12569_c0_g1_i17:410-2242(-)
MKAQLLLLLAVVASTQLVVRADLPVHCLRKQVEGKWKFYLGESTNEAFPDCKGFKAKHAVHQFEADLKSPSDPDYQKTPWTMVYDEGFNLVHKRADNGKKVALFGFNKWKLLNKKMEESFCGKTAPGLGWFHNGLGVDAPTEWGCFHAVKVHQPHPSKFVANPELLIAETPEEAEEIAAETDATLNELPDELPEHEIATINTQEYVDAINNNKEATWKAKVYPDLFHGKTWGEIQSMAGGRLSHRFDESSRVEKVAPLDTDELLSKSSYDDEDDNGDDTDGDDDTEDDDDNTSDDQGGDSESALSTDSGNTDGDADQADKGSSKNDVPSSIPRAWDWRDVKGVNYDSPVRQQGSCGSCFSIATVSALEARTRILTRNKWKVRLSPQHVLGCSAGGYAQGCKGGFPYLVSKWIHDNGGIGENSCAPYSAETGQCHHTCNKNKVVSAKNFGYVGGLYGACTPAHMMKEVYNHGPIPVALEVGENFMSYGSGIYDHVSDKKVKNLEKNHWQITNHAMVLVGWGEDKDTNKPYWIVKNSWGPNWGEDGYVRIARNKDLMHIESMAVTLDPHILHDDWKHYNRDRKNPIMLAIQERFNNDDDDSDELVEDEEDEE